MDSGGLKKSRKVLRAVIGKAVAYGQDPEGVWPGRQRIVLETPLGVQSGQSQEHGQDTS